jgi:aspartyl-tRNA(Asn)/glutamyl-tRNA(Gln) amidotransferase subunit C
MIDKETVKHVAMIARLKLTDAEVDLFTKQLGDIVTYFKVQDELNVDSVEPSFHPLLTENVSREDKSGDCLKQKDALNTACHKEGEYFKTPKVI